MNKAQQVTRNVLTANRMLAFGILLILVLLTPVLFLKRRRAEYPHYPVGIICLLIQAAYLLQILMDRSPDSEYWMALALTYIPLSAAAFIVLAVLSILKMMKEKTGLGRFKALGIIPLHGIGSYAILMAWGACFKLPL